MAADEKEYLIHSQRPVTEVTAVAREELQKC